MANREMEIERICQVALDQPLADRERFLAEACQGDPALRREIDSLLALEGVAHEFIERPAVLFAAPPLPSDLHASDAQTGGPSIEPALTAGTRLAHYEIQSMVGSGGMGEVYRARDPKLGRTVALKVLPKAVALDADRVRRFRRAARALAALSHPNIAAIYGFEDAGPVQALVLELVEGPTLAERIARAPVPLDEALDIATRIADAVETAHTQGVLHRDLKPANVKVRGDGLIKVLDFGLAKIVDLTGAAPGAWASPADGATAPGVLLGTPAYMAPEQITGHRAGPQADIWAFGCVLFEMLVGRPAFDGGTNAEVVAAVLMKDPDWEALPDDTPDSIRRLLWRCLQKDPRNRLHDMADVRFELEDRSFSATPARYARPEPWVRRGRLAWIRPQRSLSSLSLRQPGPSAGSARIAPTWRSGDSKS
jgi:serine/threonine protein kinase